jgi:hypothetical protein
MAAVVTGFIVLAGGGIAAAASGWARSPRWVAPRSHAVRDDFARDPLGRCLRRGYASLEIGVWLDDRFGRERLVVGDGGQYGGRPDDVDAGQLAWIADPGAELDRLILGPLAERVARCGGRVYPGWSGTLRLFIAIGETDPARQRRAYDLIEAGLAGYKGVFSDVRNGVRRPGPVIVLLTGVHVDRDCTAAAADRAVFVDGTFADLGPWGIPADVAPVLSENWAAAFAWAGRSEMPAAERDALTHLVAAAHAEGRVVRITGLPRGGWRVREAVWTEMAAADVDLIGTSRPAELATFLRRYGSQAPVPTGHRVVPPVTVPAQPQGERTARRYANAGQVRASMPARHRVARSTATTRVGAP